MKAGSTAVNDADGPHYLNDGWHQVDGGKTWFYFDDERRHCQAV